MGKVHWHYTGIHLIGVLGTVRIMKVVNRNCTSSTIIIIITWLHSMYT